MLRSVYTILTIFVVSVVVFAITQIIPGNAAYMILGEYATPERVAVLEEELGLNDPVWIQYSDWIVGILTGNWGWSYVNERPVVDVVLPRLLRSGYLMVVTMILVTLIAIPLGVIAAVKRSSKTDFVISTGTYIGISVPEFVSGTLLVLFLGGPIFGLLPSGGYVSPSESLVEWAKHLVLPAIAMTFVLIAHVARLTRSGMIDTLTSDYVRTARLKGMSEYKVISKHALRNGLLPTITVLALNVGYLMGSIVIVEEVFSFPGLGRLIVRAIQGRDLPVIQATVLVAATAYVIANFAADILYSYLDPRVEVGK